MTQDYDVTIIVRVNDPERLLAAALAHADAVDAGMTRDDFLNDDDSIDIEGCLTMTLDPGTLAGCEILGSASTELENF